VREPIQEGWGQVISTLELYPELAAGLDGVEDFTHVGVVFLMHLARFRLEDLVRRPRGRSELPAVGIFAQRAACRPNRVGFSVVQVMSRSGPRLTVLGLDAVDGTPVLDVKPHVPAFDVGRGARHPSWVDAIMERYF
jgi:tRNA-Thr(GGU) m(6)t(6)A37 methyltransferase TsaA